MDALRKAGPGLRPFSEGCRGVNEGESTLRCFLRLVEVKLRFHFRLLGAETDLLFAFAMLDRLSLSWLYAHPDADCKLLENLNVPKNTDLRFRIGSVRIC